MLHFLFYIYWILKQFYFTSSGGMQISDIVLGVAFVCFFIKRLRTNQAIISEIDIKLLIFVIFVFAINSIYSIFYEWAPFIISSFHYLFNFLLVLLFRELAKEKKFLKNLFFLCKVNLFIQLIIYLLGRGRYYSVGRYMGTFNDPNQFAFFVFGTLLTMYIISVNKEIHIKMRLTHYIIVIFLISTSASTGIFLGLATFGMFKLIIVIRNFPRKIYAKHKLKTYIIFLASIIGCLYLLINMNNVIMKNNSNVLIQRITGKFDKFTNATDESGTSVNIMAILGERGIDKLIRYPQYIVYGAGQGNSERFINDTDHGNEVHSTMLSILFYYGIIPFYTLILWMKDNLHRINKNFIPAFIALFVEGATLLNQRQPFFWIVFVLAWIYYKNPRNFLKY